MATGGPPFIDRDNFDRLIASVPRRDGDGYEDIKTIYRDMSRLTVAWLAKTQPSEIRRLYNELGWEGSCNARALHECAKAWMTKHHPERL